MKELLAVDLDGEPRQDPVPLLLPEGRDPRPAEAWRAAVGPPIHHPLPTPSGFSGRNAETSALPPGPLVIASWNLRVGAARLRPFLAALRSGAFTAGKPPREIVLLCQEALRREWSAAVAEGPSPARGEHAPFPVRTASRIRDPLPEGEFHSEIRETAAEEGLALVYAPSMRNGSVEESAEDRGNAILSTLPLEDPLLVELPVIRQRRTAVLATITLPPSSIAPAPRLRLLSLHLENRAPWGSFPRTFGAARDEQARALLAALRRDPGRRTEGIVLGGDLNSWWGQAREPAVRRLRSAFPDAALPPPLPTHHWELGLNRRSDWLFARLPSSWRAKVWREEGEWGSDHWPLLAQIEAVS